MSTLATDDFNRANSTGLGANWTTQTTKVQFNVSSNTAVASDPAVVDDVSIYTAISWPNDQYAKAQLTVNGTGGGGQGLGLMVRGLTASDNGYRSFADHAATGNVGTAKVVGTVYTPIASANLTWSDGDTFELDIQGTTLTLLRSGVQQTSTSDSSLSSGNAGLVVSTTVTSASADNWEGGDFATGSLPPGLGPSLKMDPATQSAQASMMR